MTFYRRCPFGAHSLYIIIRPIAVDEKIPYHYDSNGKRKRGVSGKQLRGSVREVRDTLKGGCHGRLHVVEDWNAEGNARSIHEKEHAQLVKEMP